MAKRRKMSKKKSRRDFTRKSGTHKLNSNSGPRPMRGGYRL